MKALAVFPENREIRLIDPEEPQIRRTSQVKLRMLEVGICGTDKEICAFNYGTPPDGSDYLILGHEALAEVIEVGADVHDVAVGDLVVPMVRRPCPDPQCRACRSGHPDFCSSGDFTERGIKGQHGFLAEYVVDYGTYMNVVPTALRDVAVLVEPSTIAAKAAAQVMKIQQRLPWFTAPDGPREGIGGHRALVLGAGAVGLIGAMALCDRGYETYVYDHVPAPNAKSQLVESIGATYVSEQAPPDTFTNLAGQIELIYEAAGHSPLAFQSMQMLAPNGVFIFTGVPSLKELHEVDTDALMRNAVLNNQVILGTVNAGKTDFQTAIRALDRITRRWPQAVQALITGRYPLEAYHDVLLGQAGGIKNVLTFEVEDPRNGSHS